MTVTCRRDAWSLHVTSKLPAHNMQVSCMKHAEFIQITCIQQEEFIQIACMQHDDFLHVLHMLNFIRKNSIIAIVLSIGTKSIIYMYLNLYSFTHHF